MPHFKEVNLVILTKASKKLAPLGVFALLATMFLAADALSQTQYCQCAEPVSVAHVRRAPVRHVAYRARVRHNYRAARVRTVYRTVYVPQTRVASYVGYADTDDCGQAYIPTSRIVATEPVYSETYYGSSYDLGRIARGWGRRDGFKDGYKAALKYRAYDPEHNHDFYDADNGYKRRFGSKFLYKASYRDGYVAGYDSGFRAVSGGGTVGVVRY
jgi:hypothetical protein